MKSLKLVMTLLKQISFILLISCFTMSCSLINLKKDVKKSLESTALVGRISTSFPGKGPIVVAAYSKDRGKIKIAPHYTILHDSGEYGIMVARGNYYVFAYWDKNSNLVYDPGEPAGQYGDPKLISAPAGGVVLGIDITITEKGENIELPEGFEISKVKPEKFHSRLAGAIMDLDDEVFSEEYGLKGFWEANEFFKELGGSIYFLEEYDPKKIPILFVHGAAGTPQNWKYLVKNIDRSRFQPWFFYYPSGSRIKSMAYLLFWKLHNLQVKYKFTRMYITAHSMGGLVVRSFLTDYGKTHFPYVKLFISMATPWGGNKMAEFGVEQSPAVIPSWIDMRPQGEFIKSLYSVKIPETTSFYMFYGHKGSRNPFKSNNDKTIALTSLLDFRSQSEAKMIYAFYEDHSSILSSKEVKDQYNMIINSFDEEHEKIANQPGGHIQVRFSYDYPLKGVRPWPVFVLRPTGKKHGDTIIYLSSKDNDRILGPFPSGDYSVGLYAEGTKIKKQFVPVSIEQNKTKKVNFVFTPDGKIGGYITTALKAEDRPAGMPGTNYLPMDKKITIYSITLKGKGIHRVLHPLKEEDINVADYYLSYTDFCHKGFFQFFGLQAGMYEITIKAKGYKPLKEKHAATPGRYRKQKVFLLTPKAP
ncbi:MAG: alpha/beta hydrolase [bacterium]|nr:alpha/beta hydrolase [bacterium]